MPRERVIIQADQFVGLDLSTAKIRMAAGSAQKSLNFDYRREGTARVRAGYARLIAGETVVSDENVVSDDFSGLADNDPLTGDANWNAVAGTNSSNILGTSTGRVDNAAAAEPSLPDRYSTVKHAASNLTDNHYAKVTVHNGTGTPQGQLAGPAVRIGSAGCYVLDLTTVGAILYDVAFDGSSVTILASTPITYVSGDIVRLEAMGTGLRVLHNNTEIIAIESTLYSSGVPGLMIEQDGVSNYCELDDFEAGELRTTDTAGQVESQPSRLFAFERDDDQVILMIANGPRVDALKAGKPEWTSDD